MHNIIVFDCETGGLSSKLNPITQIALVCLDGETMGEMFRYDSFIRPYGDLEITDKALQVSLVDRKTLAKAPESKEVLLMLKEFFKKAICKRSKPILAGHNVPFDIGMLKAFFDFHKSNLFDFIHCNNEIPYYHDTQKLMEKCFPAIERYNLGNCCEQLDIPLYDAHGAVGDTEATILLLKKLFNKMKSGSVGSEIIADPKAGKRRHDKEKPFLF